jgi:hypothetical protein
VIPPEEQRHLTTGPRPDEVPTGVDLVEVTATGNDKPQVILDRCKSVLMTLLDYPEARWPTTQEWARLLPGWFVAASAPQLSREEAEQWLARWQTLTPAEKAAAEREQRWSLDDWLYWVTPAERQWFWWDAHVEDGTLRVTVEIIGWPAPLGTLDWLLRAAGATEISHEENASA